MHRSVRGSYCIGRTGVKVALAQAVQRQLGKGGSGSYGWVYIEAVAKCHRHEIQYTCTYFTSQGMCKYCTIEGALKRTSDGINNSPHDCQAWSKNWRQYFRRSKEASDSKVQSPRLQFMLLYYLFVCLLLKRTSPVFRLSLQLLHHSGQSAMRDCQNISRQNA